MTVKLPKLQLPTFDGRYEDWPAFRDLFTSTIHDEPNLSKVTKLQYLMRCLQGEAFDFIRNVSVTEANYLSTWESLQERYQNLHKIVFAHMETLERLPQCSKTSTVNLRQLRDLTQQLVQALKNLGQNLELWDFWLVHRMVNCLDADTRTLWGAQVQSQSGASDRFPTFKDISKFINERINSLEVGASTHGASFSYTHSARQRSATSSAFHVTTNRVSPYPPRKCALCSSDHYVSQCPSFKSKSWADRRNEVRLLKLCFNCLGPHLIENCKSPRTRTICNSR